MEIMANGDLIAIGDSNWNYVLTDSNYVYARSQEAEHQTAPTEI